MDGEADRGADPARLRLRAESMARRKPGTQPPDPEAMSIDEMRKTLHELQVHQIELDMQNEELRRTQMELDAARTRYFDLYDLAPVGLCTLGETELILEANLAATTLLGESRRALIKQPFSRFVLKDDQGIYHRHRGLLSADGTAQVFELRMTKRDGTAFWAHLEETAVQDAEGALSCHVVLNDITDRKRTEESLQESRKRYQVLFESASDALFLIAADTGRILEANATAMELYGYRPEEMLSLKIWDLSAEREEVLRAAQEVLHIPRSLHCRKDGTAFPVEITGRAFSLKTQPVLLVAVRDDTVRRNAEDALQKALDDIRTLRGILPICSNCKKIRDDSGYWNQLEVYIHNHSEAEFSHSICPECMKKLYPEIGEESGGTGGEET